MSKIVVHRVLLYSIVQHKVWFLFRIIKRKTLTSCTSFLCKNPGLWVHGLSFLSLQEKRTQEVVKFTQRGAWGFMGDPAEGFAGSPTPVAAGAA